MELRLIDEETEVILDFHKRLEAIVGKRKYKKVAEKVDSFIFLSLITDSANVAPLGLKLDRKTEIALEHMLKDFVAENKDEFNGVFFVDVYLTKDNKTIGEFALDLRQE